MMDSSLYDEYGAVMAKLLVSVRKLRLVEDEMTRAASDRDTGKLDELVRDVQPELLSFRGLDRKRSQVEASLGFSGKRLSEIRAELPPETADTLSPVLEELARELRLYRESRERADRIMQVRLSDISAALEEQNAAPQEPFHDTLA